MNHVLGMHEQFLCLLRIDSSENATIRNDYGKVNLDPNLTMFFPFRTVLQQVGKPFLEAILLSNNSE